VVESCSQPRSTCFEVLEGIGRPPEPDDYLLYPERRTPTLTPHDDQEDLERVLERLMRAREAEKVFLRQPLENGSAEPTMEAAGIEPASVVASTERLQA
jgi:hypothetical protein